MMKNALLILSILFAGTYLLAQPSKDEVYRPKIHFAPKAHWMNDPNGLVYHEGTYHLFYQYYPEKSVWGPMHWGHATSSDMIRWKHEPIALYPDSLGYIFSGSAVVDKNNSSGLGSSGKPALVAIFTHHDPGAKEGSAYVEYQSLAYSTDNGKTWKKYAGNPVLRSPGSADFRDPKVFWYEPSKRWIMSLSVKDRINFYSSPDLKKWEKESEFGETIGAHGGVWECPDLFPMTLNEKTYWVLIVNLNPGGPNKGSATQYFVGDFNGKSFVPGNTGTKWLDFGPDEYAGVTWDNTGNRRLFIGWMSNWLYGQQVPTETWRSAMTIARELRLVSLKNELFLSSRPVREILGIQSKSVERQDVKAGPKRSGLIQEKEKFSIPCRIELEMPDIKSYSLIVSNDKGEELIIGYDKTLDQYFIDRTRAGISGFHKEFAGKFVAPRVANGTQHNLTLIFDVSSVELFADDGTTVMTAIFFPNQPYNRIEVESSDNATIRQVDFMRLSGIW